MAKDQTVLFHSTVFGPIHSRRLGTSLGINLLPDDGKVCTFDCVYCEAGYNSQGTGTTGLPAVERLRHDLEARLSEMKEGGETLDVITFSGNGEPTLHPDFPEIVDIVNELRDKYFPAARTSVLTNSTRIFDPKVADALRRVDNNILKLDSAVESTMRALDRPVRDSFTVDSVVAALGQFAGTGIIQTMLTRGTHDGIAIDNTTDAEIDALIRAYRSIRPREIMIYSIDRRTPEQSLEHIGPDRLRAIAARIEAETAIPVQLTL